MSLWLGSHFIMLLLFFALAQKEETHVVFNNEDDEAQRAVVNITSLDDLTVVEHNLVPFHATVKGKLSSFHSKSIGVCWVEVFMDDDVFDNDYLQTIGTQGQYLCWNPEVDKEGNFQVTVSVEKTYHAISAKQSVMIIDLEMKKVVVESFVLIDILNAKDDNFSPVSQEYVDSFRRSLMIKEVRRFSSPNTPARIAVFLKNLDIHGANSRLVTQTCSACELFSSGAIATEFVFLLCSQDGPLLDTLARCKCRRQVISNNCRGSDSGALVHGEESIYSDLDLDLIDFLSLSDILVLPNSLGSEKSSWLLLHVDALRKMKDIAAEEFDDIRVGDIYVVLDLCNYFHEVFFNHDFDLWNRVVDGLIAPSVYMQTCNWTRASKKPTAVVYPSVPTHSPDGSSLFPVEIAKWPRKVSGRFRVAFIGRCGYERSPGLFVRAVAEVARRRSKGYLQQNMEFVVFGTGRFLKLAKTLSIKLNVHELINFSGKAVPNNEMIRYVCQSDLIFNPIARGETFGILNAEAMICGTPVVAFNRSASQESLHPKASLLFDVSGNCMQDVAEAILNAFERPEKAYDWTSASLALASSEFRQITEPSHGAINLLHALNSLIHA